MAESTLSLTFMDLRSRIAYFLGFARSFYAGTVTVSSGVVTLSSGQPPFPSTAAAERLLLGNSWYTVKTRDSNTQLTLDDLTVAAGPGANYELAPWSDDEIFDINSPLENGLRRFYYPFIEAEGAIYQWSFLRKQATVSFTAGNSDEDLPDDFSHIVEGVVNYGEGIGTPPLKKVSVPEIRAMLANSNTQGVPKYFAIRPKTHVAATGQRFEMIVYPDPGATYELTYRYVTAADKLSSTNIYPLGGAQHSETILEACLSEAEKDIDDNSELHQGLFQRLLLASYRADVEVAQTSSTGSYESVATITYGTYQFLQQELGGYLGHGYNAQTYGHAEVQQVDSVIQSGAQQFYTPPTLQGQTEPHKWSFLCPTSTQLLVDGDFDYDLPADFGSIIGEFSYSSGDTGTTRIPIISVEELLQLRAAEGAVGIAKWAAIRPKAASLSAAQKWEALFYPEPDSTGAKTVEFRYYKVPAVLTTTNKFPPGGDQHFETLLSSCLSVAEIRTKGERGPQWEMFTQRLMSSTQLDLQSAKATEKDTYTDTAATYGTYQWLRQEVGGFLDYSANLNSWTASEQQKVDYAIKSGVKKFYFPPTLQGQAEPHKWSFLCPTKSITLATSDFDYDLPSGFGQIIGDLTWPSAETGTTRIPIISTERLLQMKANETATGKPKYAAVRPKSHVPTADQLWEVLVYPTPTSSENTKVLSFKMLEIPGELTTTNNYPAGGAVHAETILASCLSVAAIRYQPTTAVDQESLFMSRLSGSVQLDQIAIKQTDDDLYSNTAPVYGTFPWLQQEVGDYLDYSPSVSSWSHSETRKVDFIIKSGAKQFYFPPTLEGQQEPHKWSFLRTTRSITLATSDFDYDLPAGFGQIIGELTWPTSSTSVNRIPIISVERLLQLRATEGATGQPRYAAVRSKTLAATAVHAFELLLYPEPTSNENGKVLNFSMLEVPAELTAVNLYTAGGTAHADTILASCLSIAESRHGNGEGRQHQVFLSRLSGSVQLDLQALQKTDDDAYLNSAVTYGTYQWLQQEVGEYIGYSANLNSWSHPETQRVNQVIKSGAKQFYFPPTLEGQKQPHKWSFLCPYGTITMAVSTFNYDLPVDFGSIIGEVTYQSQVTDATLIPIISPDKLLQLRTSDPSTKAPKWAAVRPKTPTGTADQLWEILLYPEPDATEDGNILQFRYLQIPAELTAASNFHSGTDQHSETLLASCLAMAESRIKNERGVQWENFIQRLNASVQIDLLSAQVTETTTYSKTEPTFGTYQWYKQEVGDYMDHGANESEWSETQLREVKAIIQRGLKQFYSPNQIPGEGTVAHDWSFLSPEATISMWGDTEYTANTISTVTVTVDAATIYTTMVGKTLKFKTSGTEYTISAVNDTANTFTLTASAAAESSTDTVTVVSDANYQLPANHGGMVEGSLKYDADDNAFYDIDITNPGRILSLRQQNIGSVSPASRPLMAAVKPDAADLTKAQRSTLMIWPIPNGTFTLHYRYHAIQDLLDDTNNYPLGTDMHAETILSSCLAVAEQKKTGRRGSEWEHYQERLQASVSRDRNAFSPKNWGYMGDYSDIRSVKRRYYTPVTYENVEYFGP